MTSSKWSGQLVIGKGWAMLDARLGANSAHSHLAHQVSIGFTDPINVVTDRQTSAKIGHALVIPSGTVHRIGPEGVLTRSVYFDPTFTGHRIQTDPSATEVDSISSKALLAAQTHDDAARWARTFAGRTNGSKIDARLSAALTKPWALRGAQALAETVGVSPSRLREITLADFGAPPTRVLQWLQLQVAARALSTTDSLSKAAIAGGFSDQSHFTRRLKTWFGVTPQKAFGAMRIIISDV